MILIILILFLLGWFCAGFLAMILRFVIQCIQLSLMAVFLTLGFIWWFGKTLVHGIALLIRHFNNRKVAS